jgi:hydrogenase nickel incorporation protein HypA/HybF
MHELLISSAIVDTVLRHADGRTVSTVRLKVGTLRQVVPDSLGFYFDIVSRSTLCAGARLELELVDALLRCAECGNEWDPAPAPSHVGDPAALLPRFRCPRCRAAGAEVLRGNELEVGSIDIGSAPPVATVNGDGPREKITSEEG